MVWLPLEFPHAVIVGTEAYCSYCMDCTVLQLGTVVRTVGTLPYCGYFMYNVPHCRCTVWTGTYCCHCMYCIVLQLLHWLVICIPMWYCCHAAHATHAAVWLLIIFHLIVLPCLWYHKGPGMLSVPVFPAHVGCAVVCHLANRCTPLHTVSLANSDYPRRSECIVH